MDEIWDWLAYVLPLCGAGAAYFAHGNGRSALLWFFIGCVFGPFAVLLAAVLPRDQAGLNEEALRKGDVRVCPECTAIVRAEAKLCRFCLSDIEPERPARSGGWDEEREPGVTRACPECAEVVSVKARKCRHCRSEIA